MTDAPNSVNVPHSTLGRTNLRVSRMAIGTWGFGTASATDAAVRDRQTQADILREAFALGIRLLDSAEVYDNEADLGAILDEVGRPDDLVIITKFGHGKGFTGSQFRESVERSLAELRLETIPMMMIHDPRDDDDMRTIFGPQGALPELRKMQDEGLVQHIGVATGTLPPLRTAVDSGEFDAIQFPRLHTLLNRAARDSGLLAAAREKGMGITAAAPFAGNILATGAVDGALYAYRPALPEVLEAVRAMEVRSAELGVTIGTAALAFTLTDPDIDSTILGVRSVEELRANVAAFGVALSRAEVESIAEVGTIDPYLLGGPDFVKSFPADRDPGQMR